MSYLGGVLSNALRTPHFTLVYACGSWPRNSLTDIRKARNQARALIDVQINPNEHKKTAKAQAHAAANVEAEQEKTRKVQTLTVQDVGQ